MRAAIPYLILSLILISLAAGAQEDEGQAGDILYGFKGGINYTTLELEGVSVKPAARPFFGLYSELIQSPNWRINFNGLLSVKASQIDVENNLRQIGVDLLVYPQYKWDDLYINAGMFIDLPIDRSIQSVGRSGSTMIIDQDERDRYQQTVPQLNALLGFDLKVAEHWKLTANFILPLQSDQNRNFQLGLKYQMKFLY